MKKGYLLLTLHAHLPFVRHPEHEDFLEERWLFEAMTETYIRLISAYDRMLADGVPFRITMSVTPPLATMLTDELLQARYRRHLNQLIELSEKEVERTKGDDRFHGMAQLYRQWFYSAKDIYENQYQCNLINAFRKFQDAGVLEIITCGSTHGFLPLMLPDRASVHAQVETACQHYEKTFGRRPKGIWLPECGYYSGYDEVLNASGLQYFFIESHGVLHAEPRPKYGVYRPLRTPSGVFAFGRDIESSKQVWSAEEGYPGDFTYREYYRDIGFDLDEDYIKPYIHPDGFRINTGIKYHRITGESDHKEPYNYDWARQRADDHAGNFMFNREKQVEFLFEKLKTKPCIVAPYDAELYGHWWFEGPEFLEFLLRKVACDSQSVQLITAPEFLSENPEHQTCQPSFSSWGYKGYAEVWLEGSNDWIYRHLHAASRQMEELAKKYESPNELERRALNQAARELMLAESSDWAFIMKTGTVVPYAVQRTRSHLQRFQKLYSDLQRNSLDSAWLNQIESHDNIFPDINYRVYA